MVTRVDRLARSIRDLQDIVYSLNQRGITLRATEQPVDTRTAAGKAFLDMLGVFAEFETNLRRERQMEGIAAAKARGFTVAVSRPLTLPRCTACMWTRKWVPRRLPASWVSDGHRSTGCWITMSSRRKSIPSDSLLQQRQRLDRLPPKSPNGLFRSPLSLSCTVFCHHGLSLSPPHTPPPYGPPAGSWSPAGDVPPGPGILLRADRRAEAAHHQQSRTPSVDRACNPVA
ncbi:RlgA [Klebsiella variicola]|nr:RlgA [Klebsiella variicola]